MIPELTMEERGFLMLDDFNEVIIQYYKQYGRDPRYLILSTIGRKSIHSIDWCVTYTNEYALSERCQRDMKRDSEIWQANPQWGRLERQLYRDGWHFGVIKVLIDENPNAPLIRVE